MPAPDRGSTSLTTVLLTPVFVLLAFAAFQAALYTHARSEARAIARDAAVLVARHREPLDVVEASATAILDDADLLTDTNVTIDSTDDLVVVRVSGRAPGIVVGTGTDVDISESLPVERFRP